MSFSSLISLEVEGRGFVTRSQLFTALSLRTTLAQGVASSLLFVPSQLDSDTGFSPPSEGKSDLLLPREGKSNLPTLKEGKSDVWKPGGEEELEEVCLMPGSAAGAIELIT